jgi:hypothetical protein
MAAGFATRAGLEKASRQAPTHEPLVERVISVESPRKVPGVDSDVNDAVLEKLATSERTPRVVHDQLHGSGLSKGGVKGRAGASPVVDRVAPHHRRGPGLLSAAAYEVLGTSAAKEIGIAEVRADDVVHKLPHVPLGARRWLSPIMATQELEPPLEAQARHCQKFEVSIDLIGARRSRFVAHEASLTTARDLGESYRTTLRH